MSASAAMIAYEKGLALSRAGAHANAIAAFEQALAASPDDGRVLYALAGTARALGMADAARSFYGRVLALEPGRIEALVGLANLLREAGDPAAAAALLEPHLPRMAGAPEAVTSYGIALRALDRIAPAREAFEAALRIDENYAPALGNLADCLADAGDCGGALALYDRVLAAHPGDAQARLNRAILHFLKGDVAQGWRDYAARLKLPGKVPQPAHRLPPWNGTVARNLRLLVTAEQGVGDQLMFASLLPELAASLRGAGGQLLMDCDARLVPLFARSFAAVIAAPSEWQRRGTAIEARFSWLKGKGGAKAAIALGSLPRLLRPSLSRFPAGHRYLIADPDEAGRWRRWGESLCANAGENRRIGVCWRSGKLSGGRALQFASLEQWGAFLRDCPGQIVCVQYDAGADEIARLEALSGRTIHVPPGIDQKQELDRTAGLFASLDGVISAPTAVSWLAAGLGVKTYKLVYDSSWTAFGQGAEPFAPAARIIRPDHPGDWAQAFGRLRAALA